MSLCLLVINHCLTLYRTDNARVPFSPLKINSSTSDVLTIAGQENEILLTQLQRKVQSECSMSGVFTGERGIESGNLSKKKKKCCWTLKKSEYWEKHGNTLLCTHKPTHTQTSGHSWWIIPRGCWERSHSQVIQLWHQGFFFFCFVCY